jgi:hypothetical protein
MSKINKALTKAYSKESVLVDVYYGIEIFEVKTSYNATYYEAPSLTEKIIPVNFTPTLLEMYSFIRRELKLDKLI